jgi:hypothetical protein
MHPISPCMFFDGPPFVCFMCRFLQVVYSVLMANMGLDAAMFALCTRENLHALRHACRSYLPSACSCCCGEGGRSVGGLPSPALLPGSPRGDHAEGRGVLEASPLLLHSSRTQP